MNKNLQLLFLFLIIFLIIKKVQSFLHNKKLVSGDIKEMRVTQLDIILDYGAPKKRIGEIEWFITTPLSVIDNFPNLPSKDATEREIYHIAAYKSEIRESVKNLTKTDGKYCPIDHIATQFREIEQCPLCDRKLLNFGWD